MCKPKQGNTINEPGNCRTWIGPNTSKTNNILKKDLTSSTCLVVNGPPNLSLVKSNLEGMILSPQVKALH